MSDDTTPGPDLRERFRTHLLADWARISAAEGPWLGVLADEMLAVAQPELDQVLVDLETAKGWRDAALAERNAARAEAAEYRIANTRLQELITLRTEQRDQLKAAVARVKALAEDMRTWCSPHGIAVLYAQRIDEAIEPPAPVGIEADSEAEFAAKLGTIMRKHRAEVHPEHDDACGTCAVIKGAPELLTAGLDDLPAVRAFAANHDPRTTDRPPLEES